MRAQCVLAAKLLNETRRINVYLPPGYTAAPDKQYPVLCMPDGGLAEDFLHVAALQANTPPGPLRRFEPMREEKHSAIYHPAALTACRAVFRP
jgi:predicted alpha/beta superfamily hydrolase